MQLMPLMFSMYNSPEFETTVGKMRTEHLGRQLSYWSQDSRKAINLFDMNLYEEVTLSYTEILCV